MKSKAFILAMGLCCAAGLAPAAGGSDASSSDWSARSEDPAVKSAKDAIAAGDYVSAQSGLKVALAGDPGNADLHNL